MPTELDYFRRRAAQERLRADASADSAIRAIHLELAQRYAVLGDDSAAGDAASDTAGSVAAQPLAALSRL